MHLGKDKSAQAILNTLDPLVVSCKASPRLAQGNLSVHEHVWYGSKAH